MTDVDWGELSGLHKKGGGHFSIRDAFPAIRERVRELEDGLPSCDWGGCDDDGVATRMHMGATLPVCVKHTEWGEDVTQRAEQAESCLRAAERVLEHLGVTEDDRAVILAAYDAGGDA